MLAALGPGTRSFAASLRCRSWSARTLRATSTDARDFASAATYDERLPPKRSAITARSAASISRAVTCAPYIPASRASSAL